MRATRRWPSGSIGAHGRSGIVGVNVGANRDSEDRIFDYVAGVRLFAPLGAYLTINVSSPNTPGLRDLQAGEALGELLTRVVEARAEAAQEAAGGRRSSSSSRRT